MKCPIFQLNSWRKMFVHIILQLRGGEKKIGIRSGQEKVQRSKHLIFECKKNRILFRISARLIYCYFHTAPPARAYIRRRRRWEKVFLVARCADRVLDRRQHTALSRCVRKYACELFLFRLRNVDAKAECQEDNDEKCFATSRMFIS